MASIAKSDSTTGLRAFSYGAEHPAMALWLADAAGLLPRIRAQMQARQAHPARTLVLLPYAQLLPLATRLWARLYPDGFSPRFETTQNWVATTGGRVLDAQDISMDPAVDTLTAQALLAGSGAQGQEALAPLLVQAAYQLAPLAAAAGPAQRAAWAQTARRARRPGYGQPGTGLGGPCGAPGGGVGGRVLLHQRCPVRLPNGRRRWIAWCWCRAPTRTPCRPGWLRSGVTSW